MNNENKLKLAEIEEDAVIADHLGTAELMGWDIGEENRKWLEQYRPKGFNP